MKNIKNSNIAYLFYTVGIIDYVSANYFNNDLTGIPFSPIILGGIGSIFMFIHNSKIKESNNNVYDLFKFALFAVIISDDIIDESELEYTSSILNTLENELLLPTNSSKLEVEILNYDKNHIYEKIQNLQSSVPYKIKLSILSSCSILCVMDAQIDEVEQESIYKISNILNISNEDMGNIFNSSISRYIDFKNSNRERLEINDSEVKIVVEEKRAENKSNKNQTYGGLAIFALFMGYFLYVNSLVTIEESCDNFILNYESEIIALTNKGVDQTREIDDSINEFLRVRKTDSYINYSYEEQIELHTELFSNINININLLETYLESINSMNFNYSDEHEDLHEVVDLFELYNAKNKEIQTKDLTYYYIFLQQIELYEEYYYDWDKASSNNDKQNINEIFNEENNEIIFTLNEINSSTEDLIVEKNELRVNFINYAETICLEYYWED